MTPDPQIAQATPQATEYVILESSDGTSWQVAGNTTGRDGKEAIKAHLEGKDGVDAQFVATPARSWKPVSVKTKVALDFGDAS